MPVQAQSLQCWYLNLLLPKTSDWRGKYLLGTGVKMWRGCQKRRVHFDERERRAATHMQMSSLARSGIPTHCCWRRDTDWAERLVSRRCRRRRRPREQRLRTQTPSKRLRWVGGCGHVLQMMLTALRSFKRDHDRSMQISGSEVQPPAAARVLIVAESEISPDARVRPALPCSRLLGGFAQWKLCTWCCRTIITLAADFLNLLSCSLACNRYLITKFLINISYANFGDWGLKICFAINCCMAYGLI